MTLQKEEEDNRTVEEYLRDIAALEEKGSLPRILEDEEAHLRVLELGFEGGFG